MEQGEIRKIVGDELLARAAELQLRIQMLQQELQKVSAEINRKLAEVTHDQEKPAVSGPLERAAAR